MTLSDKDHIMCESNQSMYSEEDVKESIKELKESFSYDKRYTKEEILFRIDGLIGFKEKQKCPMSVNGKCTSDYSPIKCDGLDIPDDCSYTLDNSEESV